MTETFIATRHAGGRPPLLAMLDHDARTYFAGISHRLVSLEVTISASTGKYRGIATYKPLEPQLDLPDPLDETDHRDRIDRDGTRWTRRATHWCIDWCLCEPGRWELAAIDDYLGPLTFAPGPQPMRGLTDAEMEAFTAALEEARRCDCHPTESHQTPKQTVSPASGGADGDLLGSGAAEAAGGRFCDCGGRKP